VRSIFIFWKIMVFVPHMGVHHTKEADTTFDKSSAQISNLVYKTWFCRYPCCWYLPYVIHTASLSVSQPFSRHHKQILYWSIFMPLLGTCYAQLKSIWPIQWNPMTSTSSYAALVIGSTFQTVHSKPHQGSNIWTRHALWHSIHSWLEEILRK